MNSPVLGSLAVIWCSLSYTSIFVAVFALDYAPSLRGQPFILAESNQSSQANSNDGWFGNEVLSVLIGDVYLHHRIRCFCTQLSRLHEGRVVSNRGGWQSEVLPLQADPSLAQLKMLLRKPLTRYLRHRNLAESSAVERRYGMTWSITEIWVNMNGPGDSNVPHKHSSEGPPKKDLFEISGVFYVSAGTAEPARLKLFSQAGPLFVKPSSRKVVLFPASMVHAVELYPNVTNSNAINSKSLRISIAFNIVVKWFRNQINACAARGNIVELKRSLAADWHGMQQAITSAAQVGHLEIVDLLAMSRADVHQRDANGMQPFHVAAACGHSSIIKFLLGQHAELDAGAYPDWRQALHFAASDGHAAVVAQLLKARADPVAKDINSFSTMDWAAWAGHLTIVETLESCVASPQITTATVHLATNGHLAVMRHLLAKLGDRAHQPDEDGTQALHLAASSGHSRLVSMLARSRADVTAIDSSRWTPLHAAARAGHVIIVNFLLRHGAEANSRDARGLTAGMMAEDNGHFKVVAALASATIRREL